MARDDRGYLRDSHDNVQSEEVAHTIFDIGELDGYRVVIAAGGIGKVNTALVATILADWFSCRTIVFSGVPGALDQKLHIGDIVIAERTVQHDTGVTEDQRLGSYQAGHVPVSIRPGDWAIGSTLT